MLQDQQYLRIPGPTPVPPSVQRAMAQPMVGHRATETADLIRRIRPGLKKVFGTEQDVMIFAGSGTSGLEAAVVNTVGEGDEVIVAVTGAFGGRFVKILDAYGVTVHQIQTEWGHAVSPDQIREALQAHPAAKAVFATFCETSTGVLNPVAELAQAIRAESDALFIVDGVSCIGGVESKMDEWGIDILVTGSQKAMMLPGGLMFAACSERAWQVIEATPRRGFYLDFTKYRDNLKKDSTPFTPATSLLYGLEQTIKLIEEEGFEQVIARHDLMKDMTRAAFKALDIPLLTSDEDASPTVTAVRPDAFDAPALRKVLKQEFNLVVAGGQEHLKDAIFRIGHMGYASPGDVLQTLAMIEIGILKAGQKIELGKGVAAAQQIYIEKGDF